jgi:hypothetical protein
VISSADVESTTNSFLFCAFCVKLVEMALGTVLILPALLATGFGWTVMLFYIKSG